nr:EOG090X0IV9 [Moina brachiata]
MADKLGLGPEVKELHIGTSFTNPRGSAFHTFRYDFKPASVDTTKMATVDILPNNEVNVTVPHCDGAGTTQTSVFRGPKKSYAKECVLIIDHNTGEITLERLSHNIQLKKTRMESVSKSSASLSPNDALHGQISQPKRPSPVQKSPPAAPFSPPLSTPLSTSFSTPLSTPFSPTRAKASPKHAQPGSMPILDDMEGSLALPLSLPMPMPALTPTPMPEQRDSIVGVLSDSSSDSESESSSGSSGSDSDSDEHDDRPNKMVNLDASTAGEIAPLANPTSHLSMPSHLLSEDLQLSDSASDSD